MSEENVQKEYDCVNQIAGRMDVSVRLEQWPCAVAIIGVCAAYVFLAWINQ